MAGFIDFGGFVYGTECFLGLFGIEVTPQTLPQYQLLLVLVGFIGVVVIVVNDYSKDKKRRLFGEPYAIQEGIRRYDTRYELPRLDYVFEHAKKRILILGNSLIKVTKFDMGLIEVAVRDGKEVALYFLDPESNLAKKEPIDPASVSSRRDILDGLKTAKEARQNFSESSRSRFHILTYDAENKGSCIIIDPQRESEEANADYKKGNWVKAEWVSFEQAVKATYTNQWKNSISTWKDNSKFITNRLGEFGNCLKNVVEQTKYATGDDSSPSFEAEILPKKHSG